MPVMVDVTQEKQRISDQLVKIDAERSKLQAQFNELEIAERVLSRFGKKTGETRRPGRPASPSKQVTDGGESRSPVSARRSRAARPEGRSMPLGEATLRAVQAHS